MNLIIRVRLFGLFGFRCKYKYTQNIDGGDHYPEYDYDPYYDYDDRADDHGEKFILY